MFDYFVSIQLLYELIFIYRSCLLICQSPCLEFIISDITYRLSHCLILQYHIHGLQTPRETFFFENPKLFGLEQTNWAQNFKGIWGIFCQFISTHFGTLSPLSIFLQKSLYTQIVYRSPWFNNHKIFKQFPLLNISTIFEKITKSISNLKISHYFRTISQI